MNPLNYERIARLAGVTVESAKQVVQEMLKSPQVQVYPELTDAMVISWIFCEMYRQGSDDALVQQLDALQQQHALALEEIMRMRGEIRMLGDKLALANALREYKSGAPDA